MQMTSSQAQTYTCPIQSASGLRVGCKGALCAWWEWSDDEFETVSVRPPSHDLFVNIEWAREWVEAGWTPKFWEPRHLPGRSFGPNGPRKMMTSQSFAGWQRPWPIAREGTCGATKQAPVIVESA